MTYSSPVYTVPTQCQDCYRCIRRCPVKAIKVLSGHAEIIPDLCIACGRCVIHCPSHAKKYRDDTATVEALLNKNKKVFVSLAPSFKAEFPEYTSGEFIKRLKMLGFFAVSETAIGADLVSSILPEYFSKNESQKLFISSACPVCVEFIKKYMGEYAKYITDCASPLLAHARYLKKIYQEQYKDDIAVVFIGPCIAKKKEADEFPEIDAAITFKELRTLFYNKGLQDVPVMLNQENANNANNIKDAKQDTGCDFVPYRAAKAELYPIEGGMIAATKKYSKLKNIRTIAVSGIEEIADTLRGLQVDTLSEPLFIETLSCSAGCVNGPGTMQTSALAMRKMQTIDFSLGADDTAKTQVLDNMPKMQDTLKAQQIKQQEFTQEQIKEAMRSVGKYSPKDEINCNGCGYETCRHFAEALLRGVAEKTMCVSHMRQLATKKANGLVQAIPSGVVIVDRDMTIIECNKNFAKLMGGDIEQMYDIKPGLGGADLTSMTDNTSVFKSVLLENGPEVVEKEFREKNKILHYNVFVIEKGQIAAGVVEDITAPKNQKERTISKAQDVIDQNLSTVQKIAFLLGENAAQTESMLNSIIESYSLETGDSGNESQKTED